MNTITTLNLVTSTASAMAAEAALLADFRALPADEKEFMADTMRHLLSRITAKAHEKRPKLQLVVG